MRTFYVRPRREGGYGAADGTSYENAWNGVEDVDWTAMAAQPAQLWLCGDPASRKGFMIVFVELSYLEATARPFPRRESAVAV
jgi:hypothetical protein